VHSEALDIKGACTGARIGLGQTRTVDAPAGNLVFLSGALPYTADGKLVTGKVRHGIFVSDGKGLLLRGLTQPPMRNCAQAVK
jgi:hypothetical protein